MEILRQTNAWIAVHKPAGMVVYADSPNQKDISCQALLEKKLKGRKLFPIHRLDKQTCGILVFAFSPGAASKLAKAFLQRDVKKKYLAIVHGIPSREGVIDKPLAKNKEKEMQSAKTVFHTLSSHKIVLENEERNYSLLRLEPKTGRYHQLRRHLRILEHPIIGDPEYGNKWDNRVFAAQFGVARTMLSAVQLQFKDPITGEMVYLATKPDKDFSALAKMFGWRIP